MWRWQWCSGQSCLSLPAILGPLLSEQRLCRLPEWRLIPRCNLFTQRMYTFSEMIWETDFPKIFPWSLREPHIASYAYAVAVITNEDTAAMSIPGWYLSPKQQGTTHCFSRLGRGSEHSTVGAKGLSSLPLSAAFYPAAWEEKGAVMQEFRFNSAVLTLCVSIRTLLWDCYHFIFFNWKMAKNNDTSYGHFEKLKRPVEFQTQH